MKHKQTNIFESLKSINQKYLSSLEEEKKIRNKMKEEIEQATKRITAIYQEKIEQSKKHSSVLHANLETYAKCLSNYSTFDKNLIGSVLEKLVSIIEGETYTYQEATHETYEQVVNYFGSQLNKVTKKAYLLVKNGEKEGFYSDYEVEDNTISLLVQKKQAILLYETKKPTTKEIRFYTTKKGIPRCLVDFTYFPYIKEFIDLVIQYEYNNFEEITEKKLLILMNEFLLSKKALIEEKYRKHNMEKAKNIQKEHTTIERNNRNQIEEQELDKLIEYGVPSKYPNNLIDRLQDNINSNSELGNQISTVNITYERQKEKGKITIGETLVSSTNIYISKINLKALIYDYFDEAEQGYPDIDLEDNGIIGFIEISDLENHIDDIEKISKQYGTYKIDTINNQYLRVIYLPNNGEYQNHFDMYSWVISTNNSKNTKSQDININYEEETQRLLAYLKEAELISSLTNNQMLLYKKKKNN